MWLGQQRRGPGSARGNCALRWILADILMDMEARLLQLEGPLKFLVGLLRVFLFVFKALGVVTFLPYSSVLFSNSGKHLPFLLSLAPVQLCLSGVFQEGGRVLGQGTSKTFHSLSLGSSPAGPPSH